MEEIGDIINGIWKWWIKDMQSGKEIDLNTTVPAMIDCYNALRQCKTGKIAGSEDKISDNKKKLIKLED